jgi:hypothetical protein
VRWSKLKQRLEANFANSVRGRVELHQTRYHNAHDQAGELWITVDGDKIFTAATFSTEKAVGDLGSEYSKHGMSSMDASWRAYRELEQNGVVYVGHLVARLKDYLNQSIEQIMASPNPIIRGLGLIDRRFGFAVSRASMPAPNTP